jgi:ATP-dependent Lon protease
MVRCLSLVGGDLLSIEAVKVPGRGKISCTGKLGEVMQESVQTAFSYVRSRASQWDIDPNFFATQVFSSRYFLY